MASTELSLDCKPNIESLVLKKTQKLEEFVARLEEEKLKIDAFKRELPLCMQLLSNAMEASRQELQSQRMKQLSADKAKWMSSATLWNHQVPPPELRLAPPEDSHVCTRENSGDHKEKRKARRCWSPHLHSRFLNALHMLGGSQLATPKQITQLMKVEGLTSDEVKSHLQVLSLPLINWSFKTNYEFVCPQKYRLHTGIQAPSPVVVVGGIWVPPEYAAHAGASPAAFYGATAPTILPPR
ncbi:transcription factor NIGTH1-like isoform X1 [Salvia miltiorrhiza]|uniref:transcription factor NIGTH1-like isoform X1 n=1 Tax=Salvia miltiorrhiza TaxID=226208 RepID=UPI0025AB66D9|nr:transcription factor NIGTH1-like isoform X1 [Salvia miltiorrhiza]